MTKDTSASRFIQVGDLATRGVRLHLGQSAATVFEPSAVDSREWNRASEETIGALENLYPVRERAAISC